MNTTPLSRESIAELIGEVRAGLHQLYGARLRDVLLYGSYARGEADEESDVDVLIVLDQVDSSWKEIDETGFLISDLSLRHGVSISRAFVSENDWTGKDTNFLHNVREEAVRV